MAAAPLAPPVDQTPATMDNMSAQDVMSAQDIISAQDVMSAQDIISAQGSAVGASIGSPAASACANSQVSR
jgi:hypothetical protein